MPETAADTGYGGQFGIKGGGGTYTYIAEVTEISGAGVTRSFLDATHLKSDDEFTEGIGGVATGKPVTITLNFVPAATDAVMTAFLDRKGEFRILFPSGTVGLDFRAVVTDYSLPTLGADEKMTATAEFTPSGKPTLVTVS